MKRNAFLLTESLTICSRFVSGESCSKQTKQNMQGQIYPGVFKNLEDF